MTRTSFLLHVSEFSTRQVLSNSNVNNDYIHTSKSTVLVTTLYSVLSAYTESIDTVYVRYTSAYIFIHLLSYMKHIYI